MKHYLLFIFFFQTLHLFANPVSSNLTIRTAVMVEFLSSSNFSYTINESTNLIDWADSGTELINGDGEIKEAFFAPSDTQKFYQLNLIERPVVIETWPPAGSTNDIDTLSEITVTYSEDMGGGYSWVTDHTQNAYRPPHNGDIYWQNDRTCVYTLQPLVRNRKYAIWMNRDVYINFKNTDRIPAVPYLLVFYTK